ncbi:hypothetical protein V5O48_009014 [Marasmius crinis-equi]|uniref:Uncharacterized protein n=1 Tax=Marasmius crinis-equi TaxID=585013 RepID=A0ABR3FCF6_9AGAR
MTVTGRNANERPYESDELKHLKKEQLADLVVAQIERWPPNEDGSSVTESQITRATRKHVLLKQLLKPENGFKTTIRPPNPPTETSVPSTETSPQCPSPPAPTNSTPAPDPESASPNTSPPVNSCVISAFVQDLRPGFAGGKGEVADIMVPTWMNVNTQYMFVTAADVMLQLPSSDEAKIAEEVNHTEKQGNVKKNVRAHVVEKLQAALKERDGYEEYKERSRHKLSNPQVMENWGFICQFYNECKETRATSTQGHRPKAVTQQEVSDVLGCSLSTLKNALAGYRVVKKHGRDRNNPIQQIIDELERKDGPEQGATYLKTFLEKYEAEDQ